MHFAQEFLKARGIVINSTTVIQQAAVTGLSDSNSKCQAGSLTHSAPDDSLAAATFINITLLLLLLAIDSLYF